ncbi:MAG: AAA family ATPase [Planctomycetales bacterium]|nr:AAA family ATPase [bacterium]UNM08412.1 MAG: AAA family ATPase [Planctomycetales bacterium]
MKLVTLESARFGKLRVEEPRQFDPGLNIIIAPNQAGKTTLLTMLEWVLYGAPSRGSKRNLSLVEQWAPWDGSNPQASLVIAPERRSWPELIRVQVFFDRFSIFVQDVENLENLSERVNVDSNGEWDLGRQLLGLTRGAFQTSVLSRQGRIDEILSEPDLRAILTTDLAGLVEDPEKATLDHALLQLDNPSFRMQGVAESPVLFSTILRRLDEQNAVARLEFEGGREKYAELEKLQARKEQAEFRQNQEQIKRRKLMNRIRDIQLAGAYWCYKEQTRIEQQLEDWEVRLAGEPWIKDFPFHLELEIERWSTEFANINEQDGRMREKLAAAEQALLRIEHSLGSNEHLLPLVDRQRDINEIAVLLDSATADAEQAAQEREHYGQSADPETRRRFEELDKGMRKHRAYINTLLDWYERNHKYDTEKAVTEHRKLELSPIIRKGKGGRREIAVGTMVASLLLAIFSVAIFGAMGENGPMIGYGLAGALFCLGIVLFVRDVGNKGLAKRATAEMDREIKPALTRLADEQGRLDRDRRHYILEYELTDEKWAELMRDIPVYKDLRFRLENYALAGHRLEDAREKMSDCWRKLGRILQGLPTQIERGWLQEKQDTLASIEDLKKQRMDQNATQLDLRRELDINGQRSRELILRLSELVEPVGLSFVATTSPEEAVGRFREMMQHAREYRGIRDRLREAEGYHRHAVMPRDEFELEWSRLEREEQQRLSSIVSTPDQLDEQLNQRRQLEEFLGRLNDDNEEAARELSALRERIASESDVLRSVEDSFRRLEESSSRLSGLIVWQKAIEFCRESFREIRSRQSSSLAPRINDELQRVLERAPVEGVIEAQIDAALELRLRVLDAPAGLEGRALLERLSTGARNQLSLALRSAIVKALTGKVNAPLMFDEPLSGLDDLRSVAGLNYLDTLSGHHQVLLTSCHRAQYEWLLGQADVSAGIIGV